jgi:hypothetical protein
MASVYLRADVAAADEGGSAFALTNDQSTQTSVEVTSLAFSQAGETIL